MPRIKGALRVDGAENVVRYAGASHYDDTTGEVNGSAFDRTLKDDDGLSVTRRGVFSKIQNTDENRIREVMNSRLTLGKKAIFVEVNVKQILSVLAEYEQNIFVEENPEQAEGTRLANPAHALVIGLPFVGEAVGSLKSEIASDKIRQIICHTFPAVV
jgi:hypothetical protein